MDSTVYSQAFDHLRPSGASSTPVADRKLTDRRSNTGRAAFKKRDPASLVVNQDMGQSQGTESEDYIDPDKATSGKPAWQQSAQSNVPWDQQSGVHGNHFKGHTNEYSEDYCYAEPDLINNIGPDGKLLNYDDYSHPVDRLSGSVEKVSLEGNQGDYHYAEPYLEDTVPHGNQGADSSNSIYAFAKDVDSDPVNEGNPNVYHHLHDNSGIRQIKRKQPDNQRDSYDHISLGALKTNFATSDPTAQYSSLNNNQVINQPVTKDSDQNMSSANSSNYEEAWDTEEGRTKFSLLMQKAEKTDVRRMSKDSPQPTQRTRPPVPAVRKSKLQRNTANNNNPEPEVQKSPTQPEMSQSSEYDYQDAWNSNELPPLYREPAYERRSPKTSASRTPPGTSPVTSPIRKSIPQNYEDAWDSSEKQKELEEKIIMAHKKKSLDQPDLQIRAGSSSSRAPPENVPPYSPPALSAVVLRSPLSDQTQFNRTDSCRSLGALAEPVNPEIPLEDQVFYHGAIKRSDAERMLVLFKEGSYLIRRSETSHTDFSLTLKGWTGIPMHMKIHCQANGTYVLGENSAPFNTIPEMVAYYTQHELPVLNAERICLLYIIPS